MKTYHNYPVIKLPGELRVGFADDAQVTVTISLCNGDAAKDEPELSLEQIAEVRRRMDHPNRRLRSDEIDTGITKGLADIQADRFSKFTPQNAKDMAARFKARFKTSK